jgi:hypothetical protein
MTNVAPLTVYTANERGNAQNCMYPNRIEITDEESAVAAFSRDLVCAKYKNNYRSVQTFLWANALPMDCDNDHSDDSSKWITSEDLDSFFPGVTYLIHYSRHHMKPKGEKSARPRFHVIFLIDPTTDPNAYVQLKRRVAAVFPFFDSNAMDAARFLFGTEDIIVLLDITLKLLASTLKCIILQLPHFSRPLLDITLKYSKVACKCSKPLSVTIDA